MIPHAELPAALHSALAECQRHQQLLQSAWQEANLLPALQGTTLEAFAPEELRILDQLAFRFGKLQDSLGRRVLPTLMQILLEWSEQESFLDILQRAEKRRIIPSVSAWLALRQLRNQLAHEYPDHPERVLSNLRALVEQTPLLLTIHHHLRSWIIDHLGDSLPNHPALEPHA
ncbi:MAG: hypothetical protein HQM04_05320 [Magnetococcales bacterium]|nr:hypothetical protein [Magnetococcales bacterium]MBF0114445.1 hypothetical protein [Magnetococcales bacterium]